MDWKVRGRTLRLGERTLLMGVVNVTPDSFSDGGRYPSEGTAFGHAMELLQDGADILDVGGESTRPGATPVSAEDEARRVVPVVKRLVEAGAIVSVDTNKASVAKLALDAGAHIINDVTAGRDPEMFSVVAKAGAAIVLGHMQGTPQTMQANPTYGDVVKEVTAELADRAFRAQKAGIARDAILLDPGIGFGKTVEHNLTLLRGIPTLKAQGYGVMVGVSRKGFLGQLTAFGGPVPSPQDRREAGMAANVMAASLGADVVRVHNVAGVRRAFAVADRIIRG